MYKKVLTACAGLILLVSGMALAGVPCASTTTIVATGDSTCAPGAAICPNGDYDNVIVTVTVRDCYGTPLPGHTAVVQASPAGAPFCYCPDGEPPPNDYEDTKISPATNGAGVTTVVFAKFGGCGDMQFYAQVGTVLAGPSVAIYIASPDNNGDCVVDLIDFGNFATGYFGTDPCHDYNCDGVVDLIDFGNFATHYFHTCTFPNP
jgi:hypothetical protein